MAHTNIDIKHFCIKYYLVLKKRPFNVLQPDSVAQSAKEETKKKVVYENRIETKHTNIFMSVSIADYTLKRRMT